MDFRLDLGTHALQPTFDCSGNGAGDPVNCAGHRFLNRFLKIIGDQVLDRADQCVDQNS